MIGRSLGCVSQWATISKSNSLAWRKLSAPAVPYLSILNTCDCGPIERQLPRHRGRATAIRSRPCAGLHNVPRTFSARLILVTHPIQASRRLLALLVWVIIATATGCAPRLQYGTHRCLQLPRGHRPDSPVLHLPAEHICAAPNLSSFGSGCTVRGQRPMPSSPCTHRGVVGLR
ncbi:hypothetical protein FA95DRAFT_412760 [Auriscalpium vulgare]|uniref:Uncharacterized protein n=2 Tax=Auriscalpium vulgare TaxID=40419 RepID=A0ACB8R9Q9_9AGAM|nr:hypothetical protein FA95DRAFT_851161 [Auriscalpium vulgare]KAI0043271.1 hypothetical protein FA95DRAFT_412760 [Auriscalpium vulgare]